MLLTTGASALNKNRVSCTACLLELFIYVFLIILIKDNCKMTTHSHFHFTCQITAFAQRQASSIQPCNVLIQKSRGPYHQDSNTALPAPKVSARKQGPPPPAPSATSGGPTLNSTTTACSEAVWGITTAPGPRCWSTAVRTYQKYRLCHGSRLVVKNGSPRRREIWQSEREGGPRC